MMDIIAEFGLNKDFNIFLFKSFLFFLLTYITNKFINIL